MNRSDTITKISAALNAAQKEMGNASKGASNPFFKSKYADLNAIREACIPVLNEKGITVLQPTTVEGGKAYVETILLHDSGEFLSSLTEIIANKQNDAQAHGSGVSYARRYGLQSFLCIGAEDDDGEKAHGRGAYKPAVSNATIPVTTTAVGSTNSGTVVVNAVKTEVAPVKKGFGVKAKTETTPNEEGWA
jgi:hypothetical protein